MDEKQAIRIAIDVITGKHPSMRDYVIGANLYQQMKDRSPSAVRDHKQYTQLADAVRILEARLKQGRLF